MSNRRTTRRAAPPESAERCLSCGAVVVGGAEGCLTLYRARMGLEGGSSPHLGIGRMAWDTYCVQHPASYCVSAKSLVAHLGGLCWALEHGGHPRGYQALNRLLDGNPAIIKPALPDARGSLTIADVAGLDDPDHLPSIERWAAATWAAHSELHHFARACVAAALSRR